MLRRLQPVMVRAGECFITSEHSYNLILKWLSQRGKVVTFVNISDDSQESTRSTSDFVFNLHM